MDLGKFLSLSPHYYCGETSVRSWLWVCRTMPGPEPTFVEYLFLLLNKGQLLYDRAGLSQAPKLRLFPLLHGGNVALFL